MESCIFPGVQYAARAARLPVMTHGIVHMPMMAVLENVWCSCMRDAEENDSGKLAMKRETMNIVDSFPPVARNPISTDSGTPSATIPASIPSAREDPPPWPPAAVGVP